MEENLKPIGDIIKEEGLGRNFRGIWIPASVWLNEKLSADEKILWAEIDSLEGKDGCFASNAYFAKFLRKSERQIKYYLKHLKDERLIEIKNPGGKDRKIFSVYQKLTGQWLLRTGQSIAHIEGNPLPTDNIDYNINNNNSSKNESDRINALVEKYDRERQEHPERIKKSLEETRKKLIEQGIIRQR
jgi:hypothetical protein